MTPTKQELERLYWFEDMNLEEVAKTIGKAPSTTHRLFVQLGIRRRKWGGPCRTPEDCIKCGQPTCRHRKKYKGRWVWIRSIYCASCYTERRRTSSRESKRRTGGHRPRHPERGVMAIYSDVER